MTTTPIWSTTPVGGLPRLTIDGEDTGTPLWIARTRRQRSKGLLGTDGIDGALWIPRCNWVHCLGMRHTIDVVYLTRRDKVAAVTPLRPGRIGMPNLRAAAVLEMAQGEAARLGIGPGSTLSALSAPSTPSALPAAPARNLDQAADDADADAVDAVDSDDRAMNTTV